MKMLRGIAASLMLLALLAAPASADHDQPVANDTIAGATIVGAMPFWDDLYTASATDSTDEAHQASCYAHSGNSVWYQLTPDHDMIAIFSTAYSDFDTVIDVFTGGENIACDDDGGWDLDSKVALNLTEGQTYLIRVAGYGGDTGYLEFLAEEFIPMEATLTVADVGALNTSTGRAVVEATVECNQDGYVDVQFAGSQVAGSGSRSRSVTCGETFAVRINSRNGEFLPGPMTVEWDGYACRWDSYWYGEATAEDADAVSAMDHESDPTLQGGCAELVGRKTVLLLPG